MKGVKINTPFVWNGSPNIDLFDQWVYKVETWAYVYGLPERLVLRLIVQFLSDKPSKFFMKHVAPSLSKWSLQTLYDALFNYCFPIDFKARLRARFERTSQGRNNVQDFLRELEDLASHFPEVTDFQITQIFWRGLHQYIRLYLIEKGLNPERTALKKLVKYAVRREEAYETARREERMFEGQVPGRTWGRFANRTAGPAPYEPGRSQQREPLHNGAPRAGRSKPPSQAPKSSNGDAAGRRDPPKNGGGNRDKHQQNAKPNNGGRRELTKEKLAELRADNKCFFCEGTGHQSHNCPERHKAKAPATPHVSASSIRFDNLEALASRAHNVDTTALHLNATHVSIPNQETEDLTSEDEAFFSCCEALASDDNAASTISLPSQSDAWSRPDPAITDGAPSEDGEDEHVLPRTYGLRPGEWPTQVHLEDAVQQLLAMFISTHDPQEALDAGIDPHLRFEFYAQGDSIEVTNIARDRTDWHFPYQFSMTRHQLESLDWGAPDIIQAEWDTWHDAPTLEEWGSGFPTTGVSDRYHPARYWLQVHLNALLKLDYSDVPELRGHILVEPHALGYRIMSTLNTETYLVLQEEIHKPDFRLCDILKNVLEGFSITELHHKLLIAARAHRRRLAMMLCASRPASKSRPNGLKPHHPVKDTISAVERNAMRTKDFTRNVPKPIIVAVRIAGKPCRALLDTGSMADFMSTTLVDQLRLTKEVLAKPLPVQLAVHGSRSKINCSVTADFEYQDIACKRRFDVVNLDNYDLILGTPFLFQHWVALAWNPTRVSIGSAIPLDVQGKEVAIVPSAAADIFEDELEKLHEELWRDAVDLCQDGARTALPPLRDVNHSIPLIDESKIYSWRPSKCPEALLPQWKEKKAAYLELGRWQLASGVNASPMLMIKKPPREDGIVRLRTVVDKREQNANTHKLAAPLPDIEGILRNVVKHKYRSIIDGKDAYEQIRIVPEHVP